MRMRFNVPLIVYVETIVDSTDPDEGRLRADLIGACLAERIRDTLVRPSDKGIRVTEAGCGYPLHLGDA